MSTANSILSVAADAVVLFVTWSTTFGIRKKSIQLGMKTPLFMLVLRGGVHCPYPGPVLVDLGWFVGAGRFPLFCNDPRHPGVFRNIITGKFSTPH